MLLVVFGGDTHALIPLYMIGVFVSFTLSQAGMVIHWRRLREPGWRTSAAINGFGALVTGDRAGHRRDHEDAEGAWIIILLIPVLVTHLRDHAPALRSRRVGADAARTGTPEPAGSHVVLVPIGGIQRAVVEALRYARTLSDRCARGLRRASIRPAPSALRAQWDRWGQGVALVVLDSPYRSLMEPLLEYIEQVQRDDPDDYVTVILPEFVPRALVAAPAAQPARAADQGRAAVQAQRRRHERAVSPRPPRRRRGHCWHR